MGNAPALDRRVIGMEAPIGFIRLNDAVDLLSSKWSEPDVDRIATMIAEGCEARRIVAAYRNHLGGADELDPLVWHSPIWRNYFEAGTIDLELPLLDHRGRASQHGHTARCTREIFVRRDSFEHFISNLGPPCGSRAGSWGDGPQTTLQGSKGWRIHSRRG